jgi:hypothetical protein
MKIFRIVALALALAFSIPTSVYAEALVRSTRVKVSGSTKVLDGVALNATAALRTFDLDIHSTWGKAVVFIDLTRSAATTLVATPSCSPDGTTYFDYSTRSILAGASTVSSLVDTRAVSGSVTILLEYDVRSCKSFKIIFSGASGGASDLVDVYVTVVAGS